MTVEREYLLPAIWVREHVIQVPLKWFDDQDTRTIEVFARELVDPTRREEPLPCLLFLQGGPGGKSPRPTARTSWIAEALKTYRVILLDQRGTGRSSRVEGKSLAGLTDVQAADYLSCFRADSIVADAEYLRKNCFGDRPWSTLGQSYGGFITLTYLSQAPEGLHTCFMTGGLASLQPDADQVYAHTYPQVVAKNRIFYQRYPHLEEQIGKIADKLEQEEVLLPDGDRLTVKRLQSLGIDLGMSEGYERLLWLFDEAFNPDGQFSDTFLSQVMSLTSYAENPLFAVLHESIYAQDKATNWAAQRLRHNFDAFAEECRPLYLTGEMIYPWMFTEIAALRPFNDAVKLLAERRVWSPLYNSERLRENQVPVFAAVYFSDMYVDVRLSLETAQQVGNLTPWITNEYEHNGLRVGNVFGHLQNMAQQAGVLCV
ncbi:MULTISPECIES: alpha/beta fold hydrolase [unclassified Serratia (in: enterobacteria)]|uniref:alpha/beta fold hydrolase n=1 Tax=unclassified Serratia (in: enterobacteria) TaxID=2647522 RepID=UPI000500300C|nr:MULTISPECIES: alpha/beta fold hydrolase [unclassified Serratia (in: enterobacteria)]KFK92412.1 proline iminopeptidase [Serratia sp. Ag2]KFK98494.1 proline iminopeptidase [Serratia sp. Ag1]